MPNQMHPNSRRACFIDCKERVEALMQLAEKRGVTFGKLVREALYAEYGHGQTDPIDERLPGSVVQPTDRRSSLHSPKSSAAEDRKLTAQLGQDSISTEDRAEFDRAWANAKLVADLKDRPGTPLLLGSVTSPGVVAECDGISVRASTNGKWIVTMHSGELGDCRQE